MKATKKKHLELAGGVFALLGVMLWFSSPSLARDTDVYAIDTKQNCYLLMDSSGSMAWGVYDSTKDYGEMYDYLYNLNDTNTTDYINDPVNDGALLGNHAESNRIYLI